VKSIPPTARRFASVFLARSVPTDEKGNVLPIALPPRCNSPRRSPATPRRLPSWPRGWRRICPKASVSLPFPRGTKGKLRTSNAL
jgi:hypothetical protein